MHCSRNQAYIARMQLAVLDHNAHINRAKYKNTSGDDVFYRKYRKASKVWDVTPALLKKEYKYIPQLMKDILDYREHSAHNMKYIPPLPPEHPSHIQKTIAHKEPILTKEIIRQKSSRF